ncbi:MAG: hypothetical protein AAFX53_07760 [Bacteroidota bacterium]
MKPLNIEFTLAEKLAVVNVIHATIQADHVIRKGEVTILGRLMKMLDFDSNFILHARNFEMRQSLSFLEDMSFAKKRALAYILEEVAISDGFVHKNERQLLNTVFSSIGVLKKAK